MNQCANSLARMSTSQEADFLSFDNPPVDNFNAYEDDYNGVRDGATFGRGGAMAPPTFLKIPLSYIYIYERNE